MSSKTGYRIQPATVDRIFPVSSCKSYNYLHSDSMYYSIPTATASLSFSLGNKCWSRILALVAPTVKNRWTTTMPDPKAALLFDLKTSSQGQKEFVVSRCFKFSFVVSSFVEISLWNHPVDVLRCATLCKPEGIWKRGFRRRLCLSVTIKIWWDKYKMESHWRIQPSLRNR